MQTMETTEKQAVLRISPEEYFRIEERVEVGLEYADGRVIPKEGSEPLPDWVVRQLLKPDFDEGILNFEFPVATNNHGIISGNLHTVLSVRLAEQPFRIYSQSPNVYISLTGRYRVPDVTIAPEREAQVLIRESLVNPVAIFEVLSDSTAPKDYTEKLEEYLHIESLQEYFLVAQDEAKITRYRRLDAEGWEYRVFREGNLPITSVKNDLSFASIYKDALF